MVTRIIVSTELRTDTTLPPAEDEMDDQSKSDQLFSDIEVNPKIDTSDISPQQNARKFLFTYCYFFSVLYQLLSKLQKPGVNISLKI